MIAQPSLRLPRIDSGPFPGAARSEDHSSDDWSDIESFLLAPTAAATLLARPRLTGRASAGIVGLLAALALGTGFCLMPLGGGETDCGSGDACRASARAATPTRDAAIDIPVRAPRVTGTETRPADGSAASTGDGAGPSRPNQEQRSASNLEARPEGSIVEGRSVIDAPIAQGASSITEPAGAGVSKPHRSRKHSRGPHAR